jgi:hypothetical protein
MNFFGYKCPACGALYQDVVEKAKTKLVHFGLISSHDDGDLPTSECIRYHDYVRFEPCGHCCPDVFGRCRACILGYEGARERPGRPSQLECLCHYCIQEPDDSGDGAYESASRRAELHTQLVGAFSKDEIQTISFKLGIDYENFPSSKAGLARELIQFCERSDLIAGLIEMCKKERPQLSWQW